MVVKQFEKCPHNYVPLILGIKTAKHFFEMFCIIFSIELSQRENKIILPTFTNIHYVRNQSKPRKCPPNYVPWPSNNRAFIIINVQFSNKRALFYYIYTGNRLWKYKSWQISIFKGTIWGKGILASWRQNFTIHWNLSLCACRYRWGVQFMTLSPHNYA